MKMPELYAEVAAAAGLTRTEAADAVKALADVISAQLVAGEEVTLPGVGKWSVTDRPAREGRNPATGEKMHIAASRGVAFKTSTVLRDKVRDTKPAKATKGK